jgi:hypothetical protein
MRIGDYLRLFPKSPLGIAGIFVALFGGLASGLAIAGPGAVGVAFCAALGAGAVLYAIFFAAGLISGSGSRAASAEGEREGRAKAAKRIAAMKELRDRLSALRLADAEVGAARDLVVLEAGRFIDAARASDADGPGYDPEAADALEGALALIGAWQTESDESAIERRFNQADAHDFPDATRRVVEALKAKAAIISRGRDRVLSGPSAADVVAIQEELQ